MKTLLGFLAAGTAVNLAFSLGGARTEVMDPSTLALPVSAPEWMLETMAPPAARDAQVAAPGVMGHASGDDDVSLDGRKLRSMEGSDGESRSADLAEAGVASSPKIGLNRNLFNDASACKLVVVVRQSCPFCQHAASRAKESQWMVPEVTWVASSVVDADSFRVAHPELDVIHRPSVMSELQVQGVPTAFLIRDGSIVSAWAFRGDESPESIAERGCEDGPHMALEVGT